MRVHWLGWLAMASAVVPQALAQVPTEPAAPAAPASAPPPPPATPSPAAATAPDSGTYALAWVRDDGAESCPPGREFAADVTQRLGRSPFDPDAPRSIEIRVERTATGFRSRVHVRGSDGSTLGRRMLTNDEPTCAPLFSATALAVALLIDPDAALREPASTPVAAFTEPSPPPPPPAPPPEPVTTAAPAPDKPPPPRPREHEVAAAALLGAYALGITPEGSPGLALQFAGRPDRHWGWSAQALYVDPSEALHDNVTFSVGLTALSAQVTFRPLPGGANLAFEAGPWLGVLGTSVVVSDERPVSAVATSPGDFLFAALSAGVGFEAAVSTNVFVTARGHLLLPLIRRQLSVSVESSAGSTLEEVWTQPPVAGLFSAGVGLAFF